MTDDSKKSHVEAVSHTNKVVVRNYRLITCLLVDWKLFTGLIMHMEKVIYLLVSKRK